MFPRIEMIFWKRTNPDDDLCRNFKAYCRLEFPVNIKKMTADERQEFLDYVVESLGIVVKEYCPPGGYFAHMPMIYVVGRRMTIYQQKGWDV